MKDFCTYFTFVFAVFFTLSAPNCEPPIEVCDNGVDDDSDGLVDCADSDCTNNSNVEDCNNALDDNCDGKTDFEDSACLTSDPQFLLLNEIQATPTSHADVDAEYLEFFNANTELWFDISGWLIYDSSQSALKSELPKNALIAPHGYYVVSGTLDESKSCVNADAAFTFDNTFNDDTDTVNVETPDEKLVLSVTYVNHCDPGESLEYCGSQLWLCATSPYGGNGCVDLGSPGQDNSCSQ